MVSFLYIVEVTIFDSYLDSVPFKHASLLMHRYNMVIFGSIDGYSRSISRFSYVSAMQSSHLLL